MDLKAVLSKLLSSYNTTIILLIVYASGLAVATFIEKYHDTLAAKTIIYYSPVFFLLQLFLVLNFIFVAKKFQLLKKRKWGVLITHSALIVILAGALTSHLFSEEGSIHIRENQVTDQMFVHATTGTYHKTLPFKLKLIKFTLTRYPGSASPSSFESDLFVYTDKEMFERKISMNNILDIEGYRLFQASYDKDEKGTILSINKDVPGRRLTYSGYFLLLLGFILSFLGKNSRFSQLRKQLKQLKDFSKVMIPFIAFTFISLSGSAQEDATAMFEVIQRNKIDATHAAKFGSLPIQTPDGRIKPINTFSSEVLRKLYKSDKIGELNPDQFLLSLITLSEMWMHVPLFKEKTYLDFFDSSGNYKLQESVEEAYSKGASERTKQEKDLLKLDEQLNIFYQLANFRMLTIFPKEDDPQHKWYAYGDDLSGLPHADSIFVTQTMTRYINSVQSAMKTQEWEKADEVLRMIEIYQQTKNSTINIISGKMRAELLYNKLEVFRTCKKLYLISGGLLLLFSFITLFRNQKWIRNTIHILSIVIILGLLYHIFGIGMRWYIAGYAPWSNSYETMIYVSCISVAGGFFFARQSNITFALATLFGGVILFVSGLNWMDPQIGTLVPVLKSPWLMIHVAVIVAAYGFFGISLLLGITNLGLLTHEKGESSFFGITIKRLTTINEMSMWIGLALMTTGTFCGAIWANESWGRYWGWDPKETWALITIVIYAIVTHLRLVKRWDNTYLFNILSVLAFLSVLMTYFGVNHFFTGMHSYG